MGSEQVDPPTSSPSPIPLRPENEPIAVTIRLNASGEWFSSAHNIMTQIRFILDRFVEIDYNFKQIVTTVDSLREAIEEIEAKRPTYQIVNKSEESENTTQL